MLQFGKTDSAFGVSSFKKNHNDFSTIANKAN